MKIFIVVFLLINSIYAKANDKGSIGAQSKINKSDKTLILFYDFMVGGGAIYKFNKSIEMEYAYNQKKFFSISDYDTEYPTTKVNEDDYDTLYKNISNQLAVKYFPKEQELFIKFGAMTHQYTVLDTDVDLIYSVLVGVGIEHILDNGMVIQGSLSTALFAVNDSIWSSYYTNDDVKLEDKINSAIGVDTFGYNAFWSIMVGYAF